MTALALEPSAAAAPDPGLIAQLANEFFTALPGMPVPHLGAAQPGMPALEAAPTLLAAPVTPPGVPPLPLSPPAVPRPPLAHPTAAPPALSGPIVAPPPPGVPDWLPASRPGGADLSGVLQSLGGALALLPQGLEPPATGHPGGGAPPGQGLYFLDHLRAPAAPLAPVAAPAGAAAATPALPDRWPGWEQPPGFGVVAPELRPELATPPGAAARPFDAASIRRDFPILSERVHGKPLIWLDNAATTQKPSAVIDRLSAFYEHENSNIHRGAHTLAARATDAYEAARDKVRRFLGASTTREIVFVRGATEGINLVAQAWGRRNVGPGDEIVITWLEHHANIVPWQQLAAEKGARLRVAPVDDSGQVILEEYEKLFNPRTRIASFTQVSNALGTVTPVREMVAIAHRHGALALVDGAQAVSHMAVNVQDLGADFYVFSGHKVFAPTGIGVVWGREELLNAMPPWQGGGNMIQDVTFDKTVYHPAPFRFEAGTGNIADAVGLGAALDYLDRIGMDTINRYEHELLVYATQGLQTVPGLTLIGTAQEKAGVLSFVLDGCRTEDVGAALDREGIAVRSGHHCAQPILRRFGLEATVRPSLALYNTTDDLDALVAALLRIQSGRGHRGL